MPYLRYKRRVRKYAPKRKFVKRKAPVRSIAKLSKQIVSVKKQIRRDIEVKEHTPSPVPDGFTVAQVNVNNTGAYLVQLDIASVPQGVGGDARIGNKTKLIGIALRFAISQMPATQLPTKLRFEVWKTTEMGNSMVGVRDLIYDTDSISTVVDYNSSKNQDFIKSKTNPTGLFSYVGGRTINMRSDLYANDTSSFKDFKMFIKQQQQLSYLGSADQSPSNVRYILAVRSDTGNLSTSTASNLLVPTGLVNTGFICRYQVSSYYTDM